MTEYSPVFIVELLRLGLAGIAMLYLFYAVENFIYFKKAVYQNVQDRNRFVLSVFMFLFSALTLTGMYAHGRDFIYIVNPLLYIVASLQYLAYIKLLDKGFTGGTKFKKYLVLLASLIILTATISLITYLVTGETYGLVLTPTNEVQSQVVKAWAGNNVISYGILYKVIVPLTALFGISIFTSLLIGRMKNKNKDNYIFFGICLSVTCLLYELIVPILFPSLTFHPFFLSNLPEVIRKTILARLRLVNELIDKEKQTIMDMTATLNHELNTPLASLQAKLDLAQKKQDVNKLTGALKNLAMLREVIKKINKLSDQHQTKEAYRDSSESEDDRAKVYKLKI
jgi:hypothetical protein